jgi:small subunit ribosomal protein S14
MAKVSAVNKNDKRIKLSDKLYKKRQSLKKIIMDKKLPLEERLKHNKNYLKCQEIQQKQE